MPASALLIIDMLNAYDHEDADTLADSVAEKLDGVVRLRERAEAAEDTMIVYVNDTFGDWTLGRPELVDRALEGRRRDLVEPIAPRDRVPFIPKGRHSIYYETALDHLLRENDINRIVLSGQVTEQCILYSALDAYIRGYEILVAPDAVAHIDAELARAALAMMERNMHVELVEPEDEGVFG
jgi:nicotinamidase-related amidase